jgi:hypothetical protein
MVNAITVAWGIGFIPMTNHDSRFSDSGYWSVFNPVRFAGGKVYDPEISLQVSTVVFSVGIRPYVAFR